MTRVVVDPSVIVKWYFHEPFSDHALRLSGGKYEIVVPDLIHAQVGSALWKRAKLGEIRRQDAQRLLANLRHLPLVTVPAAELAPSALEIATATARTYNESIYFALAMREHTTLITADRWWYTLLSTGPMKRFLTWVGDFES